MSKSKNQIAKARASLIIDQPFFASLLLPMPIYECHDESICNTFATDCASIIYNPAWADTLTQQETTFVMAHETLHCVFDHMGRRGSRTPNRWNQAADYIINELLVSEEIGTMPKEGLKNTALVNKGGNTAEGVYKLLPESSEKNGPGGKGGAIDKVIDGKIVPGKGDGVSGGATVEPIDPAERAQKSADIQVRVIQARNTAKMQGALSEGLEKLVGEILKPVVDWKDVLRRFISEKTKTEYSFARPKRRFIAEDLYLPSLTGEKMGALTIAVDCSGSVSKELLDKFSAEINAIKCDVSPSKIDVIYFHHRVCFTETYEADQDIVLKKTETGGTAFSPVFDYIAAQLEQPIAVVFLTDLDCSDFGDTPAYPVLWAVVEGPRPAPDSAPFGEIVQVRDMG